MTRTCKDKRSTNGCAVCRIRHIRCDETRPSCKQCTKTGRTCEGYRSNIARLTSTSTRALAPLQTAPSSSQSHLSAPAQRALQYYQLNTATHLSGYFHDELWTKLVLQVGNRDYCVNYALVALASLHEHVHNEATDGYPWTTRQPGETDLLQEPSAWSGPMHHAVTYYSEAVRRLQVRISKGGDEVEATLLCCLLLAGFELLRGYHDAAKVHLKGSAGLLRTWQESSRESYLWSPQGYFIRQRLQPLFHRMALQATLFSHVAPSLLSSLQFKGYGDSSGNSTADKNKRIGFEETEIRVAIASPTEARDMLYRLIWQLYLLPEGSRDGPEGVQAKASKPKGRDGFIRSLQQWQKALSDYLKEQSIDGTSSTMLKLFHAAARVIIPTCMSDDQMAFDVFAAQFHEITDLAEILLFPASPATLPVPLSAAVGGNVKTSRTPAPSGTFPLPVSQDVPYFFSLDMGVLHLLYYVAIRCRVARTRYRALSLLRRAKARREGVWDGAATALVAGRVVAMEEQERQQEVDVEDIGSGYGGSSSCIPATSRVGSVWIETDLENRKVVLRCGWQRDMVSSEELLAW